MKKEVLEIVGKVHDVFKKKGWSLSVAESCTGGLISHYITALPGASTFFVAGIVSYSDRIKKDILGVSPETVLHHGVVSEQTAREMAKSIRSLTKTDCSLSTTGNLGPDVLEGKERGLIYIAATNKQGKTILQKLKLAGDRTANKEEATLSALRLLIELVE